jgi:hypothetical protein
VVEAGVERACSVDPVVVGEAVGEARRGPCGGR